MYVIIVACSVKTDRQIHATITVLELKNKRYKTTQNAWNDWFGINRQYRQSLSHSLLPINQLPKIPRVKNLVQIEQNTTFGSFLTHAVHIQHVVAREQPIGMKRKRSFKYFTAHGLSTGTTYRAHNVVK